MKFSFMAETPKGAVFKKDILHPMKGTHPNTGRPFSFTVEDLSAMAQTANQYVENGHWITFPIEHSDNPLDNEGYWSNFRVEDNMLFADVTVPNPAIAQKLSNGTIGGVSVAIVSSFTDAKGNEYNNLIWHVAGTNSPVISDQKLFQRVYSTDTPAEGIIVVQGPSKEEDMAEKSPSISLGVEAIEKISELFGEKLSSQEKLVEQIFALKKELEAKEEVILSYKKREEEEKKRKQQTFLSHLREQSAKFGNPLSKEKLDFVEDLFSRGLDDVAERVGNDYLEAAKLSVQTKPAPKKEAENSDSEFDQLMAETLLKLGIKESK